MAMDNDQLGVINAKTLVLVDTHQTIKQLVGAVGPNHGAALTVQVLSCFHLWF